MNLWKADQIMNRLDRMLENAMNGEDTESGFDETKMSALETKMAKYLAMNHTRKLELEEEKMRVHALIADISHQTKTPIANLMLYSQLLEESHPTKQQKQCIEALTAQAEKLNFLIASLVKGARLQNGIITVVPKKQKVQDVIDRVLEQARAQAQRISCKEDLSKLEPCKERLVQRGARTQVEAFYDLKWTTEAIYNIVDNAMKYSEEESGIEIEVIPYQLFCRIDIRDEGMGIREEELSKVFTRFYRSQKVSEKEGVGLGLYLAREIITKQGGYIKVSSKEGRGSVFSVFLPMEA